jgi:hypothetical protein
MTNGAAAALALIASLTLPAAARAQPARADTPHTPRPATRKAVETHRAAGTFDVKLAPQATDDAEGTPLGRLTIDKRFHGALDATSKGEMLSAGTPVKGSAGYVAIERVTGTLDGRRGSFVLQHSGTMTRGAPQLVITVVPDSGTGELTGLAGTMTIDVSDGKHAYVLEYTLAGAR